MLVQMVGVAASGVRLPDLYQAVPDRPPVAVGDVPRDDDPLSQRLSCVLTGQVVIQLPYRIMPISGPGGIREGTREDDQGFLGRPQARGNVSGYR